VIKSRLNLDDLNSILDTVFGLKENESLAIFVDLPDEAVADNAPWKDRRRMALDWYFQLRAYRDKTKFTSVRFAWYPNVGSNNNDLPEYVNLIDSPSGEVFQASEGPVPLYKILSYSTVVLSMTEFSATAPLKVLARKLGFRGATLPGFTREMIPALRLDYAKINARVFEFKQKMDRAVGLTIRLSAVPKEYISYFDLRFRTSHASGGLIREPGTVANLPSGEAYIVPYEGENKDEPSRSSGILPVQFGSEIVEYMIERNKVTKVLTAGKYSEIEERKISQEPAYGNIAEVGIGVLGEWGVKATGSTLLDEKLGLHIAFGRSEHFGGVIGPGDFRDPKNIVHIDRVYVPSTQPAINVEEVSFHYPDESKESIIKSGKFVV
jgi:hypothetical protein